ncbi:MAG: tetrahydrofolate dehydrogenase/cyclohydrolase catalytic domain-containing protein, partial [Solirubrobacterales bacterium]
MSAQIIDGKKVSAEVRARVARGVSEFVAGGGKVPVLATVIVGEDPASEVYVANKHRACEEAGMKSVHHGLPEETSQEDLLALVADLGSDEGVDGILVQLPVPDHIDSDVVVAAIDPAKDVDGLSPVSAGLLAGGNPAMVPCTPAGVIELIDHAGAELAVAEAVIEVVVERH